MKSLSPAAVCILVLLAGCTRAPLASALATPKNPTSVLSDPQSRRYNDQDKIIFAHYNTLLEAIEPSGPSASLKANVDGVDMRRYLGAGFALSDIYCKRFFAKTDEAYRRRRFGRTLTNDVGTAITTILGLVNAGQSAVTALAAATGLADSSWRNYDDSFVISPQLAVVRSLVLASQDNFRARTLGKSAELPGDFGTAHSIIERYAEQCSFLGMQSLLEQSATKQQDTLKADTQDLNKPRQSTDRTATETGATLSGRPSDAERVIQSPIAELPATATPALTTNQGSTPQ